MHNQRLREKKVYKEFCQGPESSLNKTKTLHVNTQLSIIHIGVKVSNDKGICIMFYHKNSVLDISTHVHCTMYILL